MKHIFLLLIILLSFNLNAQSNSKTEEFIKQLSAEKFKYFNPQSTDKLAKLLDDRLMFIHSNGLTESKSEMIEDLKAGKWGISKINIKEANVRIFKNDVAILVGRGHFVGLSEGKSFDLNLYYTEVWTHFKKGWLLVSRHANKM